MSRLKTISKYAILVLALCGIAATSSFAGTLSGTTRSFAHEIAKSNTNLTFATQTYTMGIGRTSGSSAFTMTFTLTGGVFGTIASPSLQFVPAVGSGAGQPQITLRSGTAGSNSLVYEIAVTGAAIQALDTFTLDGAVRFPSSPTTTATMSLSVLLHDLLGDLDTTGVLSNNVAALAPVAQFTAGTDTHTIIDAFANPPLTKFILSGVRSNTTLSSTFVATNTVTNVMGSAGSQFTLASGDKITITISGNFTGIDTAAVTYAIAGDLGTGSFTISSDLNLATTSINGNVFNGRIDISMTKTDASVLANRVFGVSATIAPALGTTLNRTLGAANTAWWQWTSNGTTYVVPYITYNPGGNSTKFRFANSSLSDVTVSVAVVLDSGVTATTGTTSFTLPAQGSLQVTFSDTAITPEQGPIVTNLSPTDRTVRAKATFTLLTDPSNVAGLVMISSPLGVVSVYQMIQK